MNIFGWINLTFAVLAAGAGVVVLSGVFHRPLSSASTVRFLRLSLMTSLTGLMPLTRDVGPLQQICLLSVYCSAAALLAWLKFGLEGNSRPIFAVSVTAVLYFDIVVMATRLFRHPPLFTAPLAKPIPLFQLVQILFASVFVVLEILALRKCRLDPARMPRFRHTY